MSNFEDIFNNGLFGDLFGRSGSDKLKDAIAKANMKGYRKPEPKVPIFLLGGPKDRQREMVHAREVRRYITFEDDLYERVGINDNGFSVYAYMEDADEHRG